MRVERFIQTWGTVIVVDAARELGMSADQVHHEEFEFHKTVVGV